jgi:hypothetical protein
MEYSTLGRERTVEQPDSTSNIAPLLRGFCALRTLCDGKCPPQQRSAQCLYCGRLSELLLPLRGRTHVVSDVSLDQKARRYTSGRSPARGALTEGARKVDLYK